MKIIDLEYLIANDEEVPSVIIYEDEIYKFRKDLKDYENEYADFEVGINKFKYLFENPMGRSFDEFFNDEIEIIEEDQKIEKISKSYNIRILDLDKPHTIKDYDMEQLIEMVQDIYEKQDEIIDHINKEN